MKFIEWLRTALIRVLDCLEAVWSGVQDQGLRLADKVKATVEQFLFSPLSDIEYAVLKRVSGVIGTSAAIYVTVLAGFKTTIMVLGFSGLFAWALHQIHGTQPAQRQDL
jgi:hypothetical protein